MPKAPVPVSNCLWVPQVSPLCETWEEKGILMKLHKTEWLGLGIVLGSAIGASIGSATHQMGAWLPIGMGIGLAIANAFANRKSRIKT